MKYLENLALENLTNSINNRELGGGLFINGRIETYSTKKAGDDKKYSKILESKLAEVPQKMATNSGSDCHKFDRKLLADLIQTMNASLTDYDFSELSADSFSQAPISEAVQNINFYLAELTVHSPDFITKMWKEINESMGSLNSCEAYKLIDSPFADDDAGIVWSFNYFFYSKDLRRICYFTCIATSKYRRNDLLAYGDDSDEEDGMMDVEETQSKRDSDDDDGDVNDSSSIWD